MDNRWCSYLQRDRRFIRSGGEILCFFICLNGVKSLAMFSVYVYNVYIRFNKKGGDYMKFIRKNFNLPEVIVEEVEKYRMENSITSFTSAMLELIRKGLEK